MGTLKHSEIALLNTCSQARARHGCVHWSFSQNQTVGATRVCSWFPTRKTENKPEKHEVSIVERPSEGALSMIMLALIC